MRKKHYLNILVIVLIVAVGLLLQQVFWQRPKKKVIAPEIPQESSLETKKESATESVVPEPVVPEQALLNVPYTVQAPLVNWNIHEESCEEAALLMTHYYLVGDPSAVIPPTIANQELINMVSWEKTNYGQEKDLNMYEIGTLATNYYNYKAQVTEDVNADNIKKAIAGGSPVMVPVITHALGNPYYGPTPTYHILLLKGYNPSGVITNDAGVKEGKDYFYSWETLWKAIDAQSGQMNQGRDMLVFTK